MFCAATESHFAKFIEWLKTMRPETLPQFQFYFYGKRERVKSSNGYNNATERIWSDNVIVFCLYTCTATEHSLEVFCLQFFFFRRVAETRII